MFLFIIVIIGVVVFYVYMSYIEFNFGFYYIIIFDVFVINLGNGYNYFSGIFSVFIFGVCVFIWIFVDFVGGYVFFEFVVDVDVVGGILI